MKKKDKQKYISVWDLLWLCKTQNSKKAKMCYMDKDSLFHCIHKNGWYLKRYCRRCSSSSYELECNFIERPLPKARNKKIIGLMTEELGEK